jgi:hypothetical protein
MIWLRSLVRMVLRAAPLRRFLHRTHSRTETGGTPNACYRIDVVPKTEAVPPDPHYLAQVLAAQLNGRASAAARITTPTAEYLVTVTPKQ